MGLVETLTVELVETLSNLHCSFIIKATLDSLTSLKSIIKILSDKTSKSINHYDFEELVD